MKETIAKALYEHHIDMWDAVKSTFSWEFLGFEERKLYISRAEAVIKALEAELIKTNIIGRTIRPPMYLGDSEEAEAPKELMDCLLSEKELDDVQNEWMSRDDEESWSLAVIKAQLHSPKLAAYIQQKVEQARQEERERIFKRINQINMDNKSNVLRNIEITGFMISEMRKEQEE